MFHHDHHDHHHQYQYHHLLHHRFNVHLSMRAYSVFCLTFCSRDTAYPSDHHSHFTVLSIRSMSSTFFGHGSLPEPQALYKFLSLSGSYCRMSESDPALWTWPRRLYLILDVSTHSQSVFFLPDQLSTCLSIPLTAPRFLPSEPDHLQFHWQTILTFSDKASNTIKNNIGLKTDLFAEVFSPCHCTWLHHQFIIDVALSYMVFMTDTIHSSTPRLLNAHHTTCLGTMSRSFSSLWMPSASPCSSPDLFPAASKLWI